MEKNANRTIVINSMLLYARLGITTLCSVFATRYALQALGVSDFGLVAVVASVITFMSVVNTTMVSASNRFIAVAIGKGNIEEINRTFNVCLVIHIAIALITLALSYPLGHYYIYNILQYDGQLDLVIKIYDINIIGAIIAFIGVPYNGLLIAKERFFVFCLTDVLCNLVKVVVTYMLISHFSDKLLVYTYLLAFVAGFPTLLFMAYCHKYFSEITKVRIVRNRKPYIDILSFSVWIGYGAVAIVGRSQAAAMLINAFFNTVMNAALGIANYVLQMVMLIAQNVTKPISPQITKAYAGGDMERCNTLVVLSAKMSFIVVFVVGAPLFCEMEYILGLWLGEVPPYSVLFSRLFVVNMLVDSLNSGISEYVMAGGRIRRYQIFVNTLYLLSIPAAYVVLSLGAEAWWLLVVYIIFSVFILMTRQYVMRLEYGFDTGILWRRVYLPSLIVVALFAPLCITGLPLHGMLALLVEGLLALAIVYIVCLNSKERGYITSRVKRMF